MVSPKKARVAFAIRSTKRGGSGVRKIPSIALAVAVSLLAAACGVRQDNPNTDRSTISQSGCTVDLKKVCQAFIDQPTFTLNGVEYNAQRLEQNGVRHTNVELPFNMPNGNLIGTAECQFDTQNRRVSYARLLSGPPITDAEVQYVKSRGWCAEQSPDYEKSMSGSQPPITSGGN
jgi:hypothetical protein